MATLAFSGAVLTSASTITAPSGGGPMTTLSWADQQELCRHVRCGQHHASWDYFPETRSGWRVTTRGERPFFDGCA